MSSMMTSLSARPWFACSGPPGTRYTIFHPPKPFSASGASTCQAAFFSISGCRHFRGWISSKRSSAKIPPSRVIVMTGWGEVRDSVKAMKLGVVDFLTKPLDDEQILQSVDTALALSHERFQRKTRKEELRTLFERLTPRERQVCSLVSLGLPNKQVAAQLGASEKTIKIHRGRVMSKLGVGSVAELVRFVDSLNSP